MSVDLDFDTIEDAKEFKPIPQGKYLCQLIEIEEKSTNAGDPMWRLKFQVSEGEYAGRTVFDNLVFSAKAMPRVKLICSRMGLTTKGKVQLTPKALKDRSVILTVAIEDYDSAGETKSRNSVPFSGYERVSAEQETAVKDNKEGKALPF